ncbi:MAG: transposase [Betaproteobacteria bacterium]|nr:transposase [Betaproteobacteria bacterium]
MRRCKAWSCDNIAKPRPDGPRALVLTPLALIDKVAALVPPPRVPRHRYYGVLAPNAPLYGLLAPAGTPQAVIQRLHAELLKVLADPAVRLTLTNETQEVVGSTPADFAAVIAKDLQVWTDLAQKLGVKVD